MKKQSGKGIPIRERQTQMTRMAILESLAEIMVEEGPLGFTVQNVADRAGVSHRTVYRHFPNREAMCEGVIEWSEQQQNGKEQGRGALPTTPEGLLEIIPVMYEEMESERALIQSLVLLNLSTGFRAAAARDRDRQIEEVVRKLAPSISPKERAQSVVLIRYLASSLSWMSLTTQFNRSHQEAAEIAAHGIHLALQDLKRRERKAIRKT